MFADDQTVSRQMVKYASAITRESIVDVEGVVACPNNPIESCSQKDVSGSPSHLTTASPISALSSEAAPRHCLCTL